MGRVKNPKTAMVFGASGLVGTELIKLLLNDPYYVSIVSVTRRVMDVSNSKLIQVIVDYDRLEDYDELISASDIYCCLGTTMKEAGSKEAFRKVDYEYPLKAARICSRNDSEQFLLISALGANPNSLFFYNKVKGEVEDAVCKVPFVSTHIFRPSLLLGKRAGNRTGEDAAKLAAKNLQFLLMGKLKNYKPIDATTVAKGMIHAAKRNEKGIFSYSSQEITQLANA